MSLIRLTSYVSIIVSALLGACHAASANRERPLNDNWKFLRGDATGAEEPQFNDAAWRRVGLPHDWSIEDLPPRDNDPLYATVTLAPGSWKFSPDDDQAWVAAEFDDSTWEVVNLPETWDKHGQTSDAKSVGWYRRHFTVPASAAGKTVFIEMGVIHGANQTYVDGVKVQDIGGGYWDNSWVMTRPVELPSALATPGNHVVAVRINGSRGGGFVETVLPPAGPSPLDPGRSAGNISTGYAVGGIGWYRQHFTLPGSDEGKQVRVVFDGSYMETTVWINGVEVGRNNYGYSPFGFDLTPYLKPAGQENILAVKVVNQGKNSRWYSGSGLYRPVHLEITKPMRVALWGLAVTTPEVQPDKASVNVRAELLNSTPATDATVRVRILDSHGKAMATSQTICPAPDTGTVADLNLVVLKPRLWSPESPTLYRAEVTVLTNGKISDVTGADFGIRSLAWNVEQGFLLNGESIKLRGGCVHHDFGPLGAASFPQAEERRVATLKAAGYNAIRCSHNMPSTAFLQACDRLGMLVIDEAFDMWNQPKNPQDYARFFKESWQRDVDAMVRRDRNHPCVVMWSIGNEIPERFEASGAATAKQLADHIRAMDSTRPVTAAFNGVSEKADPFLSAFDICGYNYSPDHFEPDHARVKNRVMFTTESFPKDSFEYWSKATRLPYVVGDFVWTAWDYRGESAIGHTVPTGGRSSYLLGWPYNNAFCGDFDVCGFLKPQGLYREVLWGVRAVAILVEDLPPGQQSKPDLWGWRDEQPSWTWPGWEGRPRVIRVYAKGDNVRLSLNGKEITTHPIDGQLTATFTVPYEPGTLTAEVQNAGKIIAKEQLVTAGPPAAIRLTPEETAITAGSQSIAFIKVEALDAHDQVMPLADDRVRVAIEGQGTLAAFGNGNLRNVASVQQSTQSLWRGRALLIVRSKGDQGCITVQAEADELKPARAAIKVQ